ncbi:MAG: glycosyl hydrolase family 2, partial [Bacteroidales bacterium]|nr:glycosyl hydrolase family 2 [Bacteroidales bacterium]
YHDSYEYYKADWTENLFDEFRFRRGYDLKQHLPELFSQDSSEINSRIIADYRTTIAELHLEYIQTWTDWSNDHGWITRNQAHGSPANLLDVYAAADIPETETFGAAHFDIPGLSFNEEEISTSDPPNPLILQFASSAAQVSGKNLVASETCTWLRDHFKTSLAQIKPEIDQLFLAGINHVFYHGNAYSPKEAEWPGWMFYASTHFEEKNAFWRDVSELNNYVARCQSILQSGKPANNILLYWPLADIWHQSNDQILKTLNVHSTEWLSDSPFGKLAAWLKNEGHSFDYISDKQLTEVIFQNGSIQSNGATYKTIIIPKTEHIPMETWEKLLALTKTGATIIIDRSLPEDVPGWFEFEKRQKTLQSSLSPLKFESIENEILLSKQTKGQILLGSNMDDLLSYAEVYAEPIVNHGINYIRRTHSEGFHYFLSNLSDQSLDAWVPMATNFESAVILDPRSSNKTGVAATRQNQGQPEIYLQLKPGESCIIRSFTDRQADGNPWKYLKKDGKPFEINAEWKVEFIEGGTVLPATYTTDHLASWTNIGDEEAKRFAGTAIYSISFYLPDSINAENWLLDLGEVRESARIRLNGNELGRLWSIPFSLSFDKYLKTGENKLEIEVTNLSANRLRDLDQRNVNWQKYFFVNVFYKNFDASLWSVMDSGLLGPVRLYRMVVVEPRKTKY